MSDADYLSSCCPVSDDDKEAMFERIAIKLVGINNPTHSDVQRVRTETINEFLGW